MLKQLLLLLLFSAFFVSCTNSPVDYQSKNNNSISTTEKKVSCAADKFGLKLFREINQQEDSNTNIFISPLSVSYALGMTLNGAAGSTYDDMKTTLELNGLNNEEINEAYKALSAYLLEADPKVLLSIANSIWYKNEFSVIPSFINTNKDYFNAEVTGLDFNNPNSVNTINNWVNNKTNGLIKDILDRIPAEAVMYLVNAIYFKGQWVYEFPKEGTLTDNFYLSDGTSSSCTMMSQHNTLWHMENESFQAVRLPYGNGNYYMTVLLPKGNNNVNSVINQFSTDNWKLWNNSFAEKEGDLWLPKFKIEYKLTLNDVLTALGMGISFTENANFTGINSDGGLLLSRVLHKTFVDVNEEGTEAAAVTAVEVGTTSAGGGSSRFYMKVDKPFIFTITEKETGSMLFVGKVVKP